MKRKNAWEKYNENERKEIFRFCEDYRKFISECKTERECVEALTAKAEANGYRNLNDVITSGEKLQAGDKVYAVNMKKMLALFQIGTEAFENGMNILGGHIDSPRLDLKQNPLYESDSLALLETHYYGGVKKYQWVARPMALHGIVVKKDGTSINVSIGEKDDEPVVGVSDLLIHLAAKQMDKKGARVVEGEDLNILIGSIPLEGEETEPVKANILKILKEKYDMEEADFQSAELEAVPAGTCQRLRTGFQHDHRVWTG